MWYSECLLRYSNISFFSTMDTKPVFYMSNTQNSTGRRLFDQQVWNLINEALNRVSEYYQNVWDSKQKLLRLLNAKRPCSVHTGPR